MIRSRSNALHQQEEEMNVEPTAEVIEAMARQAEDCARDLRRIAKSMRERSDITYASEAISTASNLLNLFRLDLLVTRPLRELMRKD